MKTSTGIITLSALAALGVVTVNSQQQRFPAKQHDVLILQGQGHQVSLVNETGTTYQWDGVALYNADGSAGAPQYTMPVYNYPLNYSTNRFAQTVADALAEGFVVKNISSDSWNVTVTLVRER